MIAALYTLPESSPYLAIDGVDCWPLRRGAQHYRGPDPVIAHPPCGPWSRAVARRTLLSRDQNPCCAVWAVLQVRRHGGILEHPAGSRLWEKMALPYSHTWSVSIRPAFACRIADNHRPALTPA